ncbi:hypothetical protein P8452_51565 [Trifolium repens]|nr:hypothetical protein P8452_51565 [Trifolium repens]
MVIANPSAINSMVTQRRNANPEHIIEWPKPKTKVAAHIAHTSFTTSSKEDWYFDSGCSRQMRGEEKFLVDIKSYTSSYVTFGDGAKGQIKGIGKLINNGLPELDNVLLVKGLKANLISISQLCDQELKVDYSKDECLVTNDKGELLMKGARSKDNRYLWVPQETTHFTTYLISQEDEASLWHQRLGHLNLKGMKKLVSREAIRGPPKLAIQEGDIRGEGQIDKKIQKSHPIFQHQVTSKVHDVEPYVVTSVSQPEDSEVEENYEKADSELDKGQIEGVDFDETLAPVVRLESIRLLLGVACILKFKLFQMDVKSAFLNGYLHEEVYVEQPKDLLILISQIMSTD